MGLWRGASAPQSLHNQLTIAAEALCVCLFFRFYCNGRVRFTTRFAAPYQFMSQSRFRSLRS